MNKLFVFWGLGDTGGGFFLSGGVGEFVRAGPGDLVLVGLGFLIFTPGDAEPVVLTPGDFDLGDKGDPDPGGLNPSPSVGSFPGLFGTGGGFPGDPVT